MSLKSESQAIPKNPLHLSLPQGILYMEKMKGQSGDHAKERQQSERISQRENREAG